MALQERNGSWSLGSDGAALVAQAVQHSARITWVLDARSADRIWSDVTATIGAPVLTLVSDVSSPQLRGWVRCRRTMPTLGAV